MGRNTSRRRAVVADMIACIHFSGDKRPNARVSAHQRLPLDDRPKEYKAL